MNLTTKLAAMILAWDRDSVAYRALLEPSIPYEHAKQMTADQIISLIEFDHHPIRKADGGPDEPWNLTPRWRKDHKIKTAKIDVPQLAKDRRIERKWSEFTRAMSEGRKPPPKQSRWSRRVKR